MIKQLLLLSVISLLVACVPVTSTPISSTGGDVAPSPTREGAENIDSEPIPTREGVENTESDNSEATPVDSGSSFGLNEASQGTGFTADIDGAETLTINENGTINCENNVYVIRGALDTFPQVSLILPDNASLGNFNLVNNPGDGSAASATVFFQDGRAFASSVDGILIIEALATQAGQAVTGSFDFSAGSGSQTINVRGEFNFISGDNSVYCS